MNHTVYMEGGSIINAYRGTIIESPAVLVSKEDDVIHGWGSLEDVEGKFAKYVQGYTEAGMMDEVNDLMFIELSDYKITREMACYVIRRMTEFTATGFITKFCKALSSPDPVGWLKSEMERVPISLDEKEW